MDIFEKNMEFIKKDYVYIEEKIRNIDVSAIADYIGIEQAENGTLVLFEVAKDRKWYLNSRLEPQMAAEQYGKRYEIRPYGVYFIFGFSDGKCIRNLLNRADDTNIFLVRIPNIVEFAVACHYFDIRDVIQDDRIYLCFADEMDNTDFLMQEIVEYTRIKLIEFCILPGYDVRYYELCEEFMDDVLNRMKNMIVNKSTQVSFNRVIPQRILFNMKHMIEFSNIIQLKTALVEKSIQDIPAIIVSAGPSLDKNIHLLKKAQGKAIIIAVDASIRSVMQAGVRPDLLCSIDPKSPEKFFTGLDLRDIYWVCNQLSNSVLLKKYANHVFYYGSYGKKWNEIVEEELGYRMPALSSGGSVSTEALSLALYLGFKKIVLIGQDLAFTGGVTHTKGIEDALGDKDEYIKRRRLVEVEGIDGNMLQTDVQMWFYKQWLERAIHICKKKEIQVIDATEGGARIEGAELMPLEEVLNRFCTKECDIHQVESNILPMFSVAQKTNLIKKQQKMYNEILQFQKKVKNIIVEQEKILEEIKKMEIKSPKLTEQLRKLSVLNQTIDEEKMPILDYISMYATNEEYEVGEDIYAAEDLQPEQLVEKSLTLLRGYQKGARLFLEDFENIILKEGY